MIFEKLYPRPGWETFQRNFSANVSLWWLRDVSKSSYYILFCSKSDFITTSGDCNQDYYSLKMYVG